MIVDHYYMHYNFFYKQGFTRGVTIKDTHSVKQLSFRTKEVLHVYGDKVQYMHSQY